MMRRWGLQVWLFAWLIMVWVLLWGSLTAANVISGFVVALIITVLLPLPVVPIQGRVHPLALLGFAGWVAWYLVLSSAQLAWLAIRPGPPPQSAVLRARLSVKSDLVLAMAVHAMNLTPGTIVLQIDKTRRLVYVHVIDVESPRAVDRFYKQIAQLERLLITAFERESEWQPSAEESPAEEPPS